MFGMTLVRDRLIVALAAACALGGCSLLGVTEPPATMPSRGPVDYTDSRGLPIIDTVFAVAGIGTGTALYVVTRQHQPDQMAAGLGFIFVGVPALVVGLFSTISATKGFSRVSRCIDAKEAQRSREEHQREHDEEEQRSEALSRERMQVQEQVRILTEAAAAAARNGDCASVAKLDTKVRAIDAAFHDAVFLRDGGIAGCLAEAVAHPPAE